MTPSFFLLPLALILTAAPPVGSTDYELMAPYKDAISSLVVHGVRCCDWADGRPVRSMRCEVKAECPAGWVVRFLPDNNIGAPFDKWLPVPANSVAHESNPTGVPIAWFRQGAVVCFWPNSES